MSKHIKVIIGLGNDEPQYLDTRHNAGFWFADRLADNASFVKHSSLFCRKLNIFFLDQKILLIKPTTLMNLSGRSVSAVLKFYKLQPHEILVVHDDLDIEEGCIKLKTQGGYAGHNGLLSIAQHLGTDQFMRLRIGIGRPLGNESVSHFVLAVPSKNRKARIDQACEHAIKHLLLLKNPTDFMGMVHARRFI